MQIDQDALQNNAKRLVSAAMAAGADHCDVVVANGHSTSLFVRDGKVENTDHSEGDDFSLRVMVGKRVAAVSTNQIDDLEMIAERAVAMAKVSPEDPFQGLPDRDQLAADFPDLDLFDDYRPSKEEMKQSALAVEGAGLAVDGVSKSMGASSAWGITGFVLATSDGFSGSFARTGYSRSTAMVSGEGEKMERDHDVSGAVHYADLRACEEIGRTAGERAVRRRNPRKISSGNYPIIIDRRIAGRKLGALLGAINGASVARKTSFWRNEMGNKVASAALSVQDNPLLVRGQGSQPFDGEGLAGKPLTLIENGVLNHWLLDCATARELEMQSNARAARSGSGTSPSSTNAWIEAGEKSIEEFARDIQTGLYVTETIGHGINMVTGDYSKGASGFWIEKGEITHPVAEITIAGNLKDMFLNMTPGSDLEFRSSVNSPSLLVDGMAIGGK